MAALLDIHALHLAPIDELGGAEQWQHHPEIVALRQRLEARLRARLDAPTVSWLGGTVGAAMRTMARAELVPPICDWLAEEATRAELIESISFEGGPDANFDDLVALCQVGLRGRAKLTLGANYWDEMGRGDLAAVHTELHDEMASALRVRTIALDELPTAAMERTALNGYLATHRALQPEMIGSLGMIECQAGPRCRRVVAAMRRLDIAEPAMAFYAEHAAADPHHGRDWIEGAVTPLVEERAEWGSRILTGAWWRWCANRRFFAAMERHFERAEPAA